LLGSIVSPSFHALDKCLTTSFRILITGEQSGLVETITDAVSVHSIKKGEYARRVAEGEAIGTVSLMDHFVAVCPPFIVQVELMVDIWETRFWAICPSPAKLHQIPSWYVSSPHDAPVLTSRILGHNLPTPNQGSS
jgi:hypothetical protein